MNRKAFILAVVLRVFIWILSLSCPTAGEASTCLAVYKEGGAPAAVNQSTRCQSATRQGRRKYMEDRTFCTLDIRIPFPHHNGTRDTPVGIVAVFDGHNGAEASEMASNLLLKYFMNHALSFLSNTSTSMGMLQDMGEVEHDNANSHNGRNMVTLSTMFDGDGAFQLEILKESLVGAIVDIDSAFSEEASRYNFTSGSTATVVLMADGQILVANVGDSKAFLCSQTFQSPSEAKATLMRLYKKKRQDGVSVRIKDFGSTLTHFSAKEFTNDHHPDRADERSRVESAGGHVLEWAGVSRVNGQLAVSRAIGDVSYKKFGVISVPEVTDWQPMTRNDSYLVVASDGVFEKQSPQDVCDLLMELRTTSSSSSCSYSLADSIVDTAIGRGSMDNVAVVIVPFGLKTQPSHGCSEVRQQTYVDEDDPV
ncbi:unnamed protein product [Lactuca saligna]|uniref:PPM-type phosphatase domain-containing protein n=1 Tax=Lactuca saligna TaxID=75948 RepID=A0AA36EP88_LACSI|nr:unnamed protein product [Lactuca saligna]